MGEGVFGIHGLRNNGDLWVRGKRIKGIWFGILRDFLG